MIPLFGSREKSAKCVVFVQSLLYCSQPLAAPIHPMPLQVFTAKLKIIGAFKDIIIDIICPGHQQQFSFSQPMISTIWPYYVYIDNLLFSQITNMSLGPKRVDDKGEGKNLCEKR